MDFRPVRCVNRQHGFMRRPPFDESRIGWIVAKLIVLDQVPDHVHPKAVDALAKPVTHHLVDGAPYAGIAPVQVRLLGQKGVIVVLPGHGIVLPGAAAEFREPVVWRPACGRAVAPDVPVALAVLAGAAAFDKPWMLVGRMVRNQIEDEFKPCACTASISASKSAIVPKRGSIPV